MLGRRRFSQPPEPLGWFSAASLVGEAESERGRRTVRQAYGNSWVTLGRWVGPVGGRLTAGGGRSAGF